MQRVHHDQTAREDLLLDLDEIARQGARRMLAEALEAEVEAYQRVEKLPWCLLSPQIGHQIHWFWDV